MRHLKIFNVEQKDDVLIVTPKGEGSAFRYQDLHMEANAIRQLMMKPENRHLIMNLAEMSYFGSEFIGSLVSMMRETRARGGKAFFCNANEQMYQVLQNMSLFKLWPHQDSVDAALTHLAELTK